MDKPPHHEEAPDAFLDIDEDPDFHQRHSHDLPPFDIPQGGNTAREERSRIPKTLHLWVILGLGLLVGIALLAQAWLTSPKKSKTDPAAHAEAPLAAGPPPLAPLQKALDPEPTRDLAPDTSESIRDLLKKTPGQLPGSGKTSAEDLHRYDIDRSESLIAGAKMLALNHSAIANIGNSVTQMVSSLSKALPSAAQGLDTARALASPAPVPPAISRMPALHPTPHTPGPLLLEGSSIPCVLLSEVRSDLPGMIVAQVTEDIYDSEHSTLKVIPRGARLIGRYDSRITQGQQRLMASFHRLILPNGSSVIIDKMDGAETDGSAGLKGDVDTHFWARFGQAFLIAGLARVTEPSNTGTPSTGLAPLIAPNAAGQILIDTSRMNLQAAGALQPTITVQRGETFLIMVNHDLALPEFKDGS